MPTIVANFVSSISTKKNGDFASKMWASYTQLNPGVYSDAIATEFKRRMKPDYIDSSGVGYYYNTFGPSGLNKTTADWIGIMVTSSATATKTNTKTGAVMKWNMDGTIVAQNNTPAYVKGANAGIVTFTSTDGFGGVTVFNCSSCNLTDLSGLYGFTKLNTFQCNTNQLTALTTYEWTTLVNFVCHTNKLTSLTTYLWDKLAGFYCNSNQLTSLTTYVWPNLAAFYCGSNYLTSLTNTGTNKMSDDNESINLYPTAMVDSRLAYWNSVFSATPPIKNLTLNLGGATMGIPTGGANNADYIGIIANVQAAGYIPTVLIRTT